MVDLSSSGAASLVCLPNELLDVILLNCNTQSLYSLLLVCKRLYDPALRQLLYHIEFRADFKSFQQQILLLRTILEDPSYSIYINSLYLSEQGYPFSALINNLYHLSDASGQSSNHIGRTYTLKDTYYNSSFPMKDYYTVVKKIISTTNLAFLQGWPATINDVKFFGADAYRHIDTSLLYHLDHLVHLRIDSRVQYRSPAQDLSILCSSEFGRIRKHVLPKLKCFYFNTDSSFLHAAFAFALPQVQLIEGLVVSQLLKVNRPSNSRSGISKSFRKHKKEYSIVTTELSKCSFPTSKLLLTNLTHIYICLIDPPLTMMPSVDKEFIGSFTETIRENCKANLVVLSFLGRVIISGNGVEENHDGDWVPKMGLYDFKKLKKLTLSLDLFGPRYIFPIDILVRNLMVVEIFPSTNPVSVINDLIWRNMNDDDYSGFQKWTMEYQESEWYQKQRESFQPTSTIDHVEDLSLSKILPPNIQLLALQQNGVGHGFLDYVLMHMNQDKSFLPHLKQIGFICWLPPINGVVKSLSDKGIQFRQYLPVPTSRLCYYVKKNTE